MNTLTSRTMTKRVFMQRLKIIKKMLARGQQYALEILFLAWAMGNKYISIVVESEGENEPKSKLVCERL